ncbi:MAG TPA: OmpA family protein [Polyangiales bacterium]
MDDGEPAENFWPSFTDLISTIALILFVLVLLAFIQNLISGKNLSFIRSQLAATMKQLGNSRVQLASSEQKLKALAAEIEAGQAQLKLSEAKVAAQETAIADSNLQLDALRTRLRGIALLRLDVLDNVKKSLETQLAGAKGAPSLTVAENGNIVLNESLVFEFNSYTIKREGKPLLNSLAATFARVLADPAVRANIDVILVQGHTDERGSLSFNRELSAKRANTVLDFMLEANRTLEQEYAGYFASSAYSESRPVSAARNEQAYEQNRRIEISIVLKDGSVRGLIDDYTKSVQAPSAAGAPP